MSSLQLEQSIVCCFDLALSLKVPYCGPACPQLLSISACPCVSLPLTSTCKLMVMRIPLARSMVQTTLCED